jgi:hypothetical protein
VIVFHVNEVYEILSFTYGKKVPELGVVEPVLLLISVIPILNLMVLFGLVFHKDEIISKLINK